MAPGAETETPLFYINLNLKGFILTSIEKSE